MDVYMIGTLPHSPGALPGRGKSVTVAHETLYIHTYTHSTHTHGAQTYIHLHTHTDVHIRRTNIYAPLCFGGKSMTVPCIKRALGVNRL